MGQARGGGGVQSPSDRSDPWVRRVPGVYNTRSAQRMLDEAKMELREAEIEYANVVADAKARVFAAQSRVTQLTITNFFGNVRALEPVSYTHLTLPTICSV